MRVALALLLLCSCSCASINQVELVRFEATLTANAEAAVLDGGKATVETMQRAEQDQAVALAVLHGTAACEQRASVAAIRQAWAKAAALAEQAKSLHDRLVAEAAKPALDAALVQALTVELNGVLTALWIEVETGRVRVTTKR